MTDDPFSRLKEHIDTCERRSRDRRRVELRARRAVLVRELHAIDAELGKEADATEGAPC